jgi:hypothetical protein
MRTTPTPSEIDGSLVEKRSLSEKLLDANLGNIRQQVEQKTGDFGLHSFATDC